MTTHEEVIQFMQEKGISVADIIQIQKVFRQLNEGIYPFLRIERCKSVSPIHCKSTIPEIEMYGFATEQEVMLANAIYENIKNDFNPNNFVQILKYSLRIMGVKSEWTK
ncbi:MAG: hypothetical protein WBP33_00845 [Saprospiraceae bacterium]